MIHKSTLSRLAVLAVVATVLMTGFAGVAAANHDVDQEATVEQDQDNDQTNAAFYNGGDQTNINQQSQFGAAVNLNQGSSSGDVDQDATVEQDQDNDQTNFAVINGGDQTNYNGQSQTGIAVNYNG